MITFFTVLFALLGINALLLIFSVNGAKESFKKSMKSTESTITKIFPRQISETEYKKAV